MHRLIEVAATVTDAVFMAWFVPRFCGVSVKDKRRTLCIPLVYCILQLLMDIYLKSFDILPLLVPIALWFVYALSLIPKRYLRSLFCTSCFMIPLMLTNTLLFAFFSVYLDDVNVIMPGANVGIRTMFLIIAKIVLFVFYRLMLFLFGKDKELGRSGGILSLVWSLATAAGIAVLMKTAIKINYTDISTEVFIVVFLLMGINVAFYYLLSQNQKLEKSKYELQLMKDRISFEEKRSEDAAIIWENIKKVRHDLKNHFTYLRLQLDAANYEECKQYLGEIQAEVDSMGSLIRSGNSAIDYLINTKLSAVKGAQIFITGDVESFSDVTDLDMVCILGNILDNAVEALAKVEGDKRIELYFSKVNGNRIIVCKNTVSASVLDSDKRLIPSKQDTEFHGLGHKIIETTTEKYGGYVDYFEEDGMFGIQVSIPSPTDKDN